MHANIAKNEWLYNKPIIHRGRYAKEVLEHTKDAFVFCKKEQLPVEVDLLQLADSEIIVWRDGLISDNCTGIRKRYSECSLREVRESVFNTCLEGQILTLKDFLELINEETPILIEPKTNVGIEHNYELFPIADKIVQILGDYTYQLGIHSANPYLLRHIRDKVSPKVPVGQISWSFDGVELESQYLDLHKKGLFLSINSNPDFISYKIKDLYEKIELRDMIFNICEKLEIGCLGWTVTDAVSQRMCEELNLNNMIIEGSLRY